MRQFIFLLFIFFQIVHAQEFQNNDSNKNKGYFNISKVGFINITNSKQETFVRGEGGFYSDLDTTNSYAWSLQTINGYFISPHFSVGIGLGLDGYHNPNINTLPLFIDARGYLSENKNSAYSFIDVGPTIRLGDGSSFRKGMMLNFGLGYKFSIGHKLFLVSDVFYSHKTVSLTDEWIKTSDNVIKSNGVGLSIGIIL